LLIQTCKEFHKEAQIHLQRCIKETQLHFAIPAYSPLIFNEGSKYQTEKELLKSD